MSVLDATMGSTGAEASRLAVIDTDTHVARADPRDPRVAQFLPQRWRDHLALVGFRPAVHEHQFPRQRQFAHRTDSVPPGGGEPGTDPAFAREQLLDAYDMTAAMINDIGALAFARGSNNYPLELSIALARASNDYHREYWLNHDERWRGSIIVTIEDTAAAVAEIERCVELDKRFVQLFIETRTEWPIGNPRYWPIFEAVTHHDLPIAFHVGSNRHITGTGMPSFYAEEHTSFPLRNFYIVASLIFEGVFDRFPSLKVAFLELGWSWLVPYMWRMDASWRVLKREVGHLQRKPSEYAREHFWFSTQPAEEPEKLEWYRDVFDLFEQFGMGERLMYSSDYPHWDFDAPSEAVPSMIDLDARRRILGENASRLYGIPLRPGSGIDPPSGGA